MTKFTISSGDSNIELEYDDTKKLIGYCETAVNKWMRFAVFAVFIIAVILLFYDKIKDIMRIFSAVKGAAKEKVEVTAAKYFGFTKGNILRSVGLFVLVIIGLILFSQSSTTVCLGKEDAALLIHIGKAIKYNDQGTPIGIVIPKKE